MPLLPWHCYHWEEVKKIVEQIGVLSLDKDIMIKTRGCEAKARVEVNLIKGLPDSIWVGFDDGDEDGYWQPLKYEGFPDYYQYFKHQGHKETQ